MAENLMQAQKTGPFLSFSPSLPQPPCNKESLVTYYGVYSSSHRGKCKRENREELINIGVVVGLYQSPLERTSIQTGPMDSENLRSQSPDLQR